MNLILEEDGKAVWNLARYKIVYLQNKTNITVRLKPVKDNLFSSNIIVLLVGLFTFQTVSFIDIK